MAGQRSMGARLTAAAEVRAAKAAMVKVVNCILMDVVVGVECSLECWLDRLEDVS